MTNDIALAQKKETDEAIERAVKRLQSGKVACFVLVMKTEALGTTERIDLEHSTYTRYDHMVGMLDQAKFKLNSEFFDPERK